MVFRQDAFCHSDSSVFAETRNNEGKRERERSGANMNIHKSLFFNYIMFVSIFSQLSHTLIDGSTDILTYSFNLHSPVCSAAHTSFSSNVKFHFSINKFVCQLPFASKFTFRTNGMPPTVFFVAAVLDELHVYSTKYIRVCSTKLFSLHK